MNKKRLFCLFLAITVFMCSSLSVMARSSIAPTVSFSYGFKVAGSSTSQSLSYTNTYPNVTTATIRNMNYTDTSLFSSKSGTLTYSYTLSNTNTGLIPTGQPVLVELNNLIMGFSYDTTSYSSGVYEYYYLVPNTYTMSLNVTVDTEDDKTYTYTLPYTLESNTTNTSLYFSPGVGTVSVPMKLYDLSFSLPAYDSSVNIITISLTTHLYTDYMNYYGSKFSIPSGTLNNAFVHFGFIDTSVGFYNSDLNSSMGSVDSTLDDMSGTMDSMNDTMSSVDTTNKNIFQKMGDMLSGIVNLPANLWAKMSTSFASLISGNTSIISNIGSVINLVTNLPSNLWAKMSVSFSTLISGNDAINNTLGNLLTGNTSVIGHLTSLVSGFANLPADIWGKMSASFSTLISGNYSIVTTLGNLLTGNTSVLSNLSTLINGLSNLPSSIWSSFSDGLMSLFIPRSDFLTGKITEFRESVPIIDTVSTSIGYFYDNLKETRDEVVLLSTSTDTEKFLDATRFWITLPKTNGTVNLEGKRVCILDFAWYLPYKEKGDMFISAFMLLSFVFYLYNDLPNVISGIGGGVNAVGRIYESGV